ncbi:hypothetical protein D3C80_1836620 [compost metagenome]
MYYIRSPAAETVLLGQQSRPVRLDTVALLLQRLHKSCYLGFRFSRQRCYQNSFLTGKKLTVLAYLLAGKRLIQRKHTVQAANHERSADHHKQGHKPP